MTVPMNDVNLTDVLLKSLEWASERDYAGWDYADGLSSPLVRIVDGFDSGKLVLQETVKRSPRNIRPILRVPQRRSFKGSALFLLANLTAFERTGEDAYLAEAIELGEWLLTKRRREPFGWGHNHPLQTLSGTVPRNTPSVVTTNFVVDALVRLAEYHEISIFSDLPELIESLIVNDLGYERTDQRATIDYRVGETGKATIINANALGGKLLTTVALACDAPHLLDRAEPIFQYVAAQQTAAGGWRYADPPGASHLSMDPHHNGFILESFREFRAATGRDQFAQTYSDGIACFSEKLFDPTGAPRWDESTRHPHDIHGAAQGIITGARDGRLAFADRILAWTIANLYHAEGRFGYRIGRIFDRQLTLMRWSQAWMCYALATRIQEEELSIAIEKPGKITH